MDTGEYLAALTAKNKTFYEKLCLKYVQDPGRVGDLLHDGFVKFLESGRAFTDLQEAERYLCRLLINHFIDHLRFARTRPETLQGEPSDHDRRGALESGPEQEFLLRQDEQARQGLIARVRGKIESLPVLHRELIEMAFLRDPPLTLREISAMKRIPISTLHSRVRQAVEALREALGPSAPKPRRRPRWKFLLGELLGGCVALV